MNIGIVGSEAAKFTEETQRLAEAEIQDIICNAAGLVLGETYRPKTEAITVVSGHCHLGGVDIFAEEVAAFVGANKAIFPPKNQRWEPDGYKARNIQIATYSDIVYVITVKELPATYKGMRFKGCYHCEKRLQFSPTDHLRLHNATGWDMPHVKSGAC